MSNMASCYKQWSAQETRVSYYSIPSYLAQTHTCWHTHYLFHNRTKRNALYFIHTQHVRPTISTSQRHRNKRSPKGTPWPKMLLLPQQNLLDLPRPRHHPHNARNLSLVHHHHTLRIQIPRHRCNSHSLTQFDYSNDTNTLRYNMVLNIPAQNPNKKLKIYYDIVLAIALYKGVRFATTDVNMLQSSYLQDKKGTNRFSAVFSRQCIAGNAQILLKRRIKALSLLSTKKN